MRFCFLLFAPFALFIAIAAQPSLLGLSALGDKIRTYAEEKLHEAALEIPAVSAKLAEFKAAMAAAVTAAEELRSHIEHSANISLATEEISEQLSAEFALIYEKFKAEFTLPLPSDQNARYEERVKKVDWLLIEIEHILVRILPIPEAEASKWFQKTGGPHIKQVLLVTGRLIDNHPVAFRVFMVSGATRLLPGSWLLRHIFSLALARVVL